ncbi:2-oxoglutarate dehydrogenase E1 component [Isosphaera pallida ATCC 43644]|uniref:oxoglutarate dehydrogenase (succinyl-transferring) n=1 Tax=Isosphaera pallida (strain ATCC 43644 / DSM 9630 / IS1B) TaxID=575540 RepID=E8R4Q0_ISOPI|nr:2-oxoglutarate dehydrogenase E1 component [Isosphaera pallida]ADV60641.1 2-oxoglutarate dehydrogenase E1 component [Isosphaera pallida ATCC 43644]
MNRSTVASRWNLDLLEAKLADWKRDPLAVEESWRLFFEGYELGLTDLETKRPAATAAPAAVAPVPPPASEAGRAPASFSEYDLDIARKQASVTRLVDAYREIGHFLADLDPLQLTPKLERHELLDLEAFDLDETDLDTVFYTRLFEPNRASLRELIAALRETYCRTIGVEYMHIHDNRIRQWLQARMEPIRNRPNLGTHKKRRLLLKLYAADLFERFLQKHYAGQKRFGLEGAESVIPLIDAIIERGGAGQVREVVLGMPHRGRLNVLANILHKPYGMIFGEFEGHMAPETVCGDGDVKYHLGFSADHVTSCGQMVHLSLTPNPSHLEAVNPVVEGRVRAKQRHLRDRDGRMVLPLLIHGDAAFAGQGIVAETLNLSRLPGYRTGGTVHIIVNNQIGFTTAPKDARSSPYCTDVAKMIDVPIFHVNGDDPEAVVHVAEIALDFRQTFGMDVVIDLVCYRRHGHNELDEPRFTQPRMYRAIDARPPVKQIYTDQLIASGELTRKEAETIAETFEEKMEAIFNEIHNQPPPTPTPPKSFGGPWKGLVRDYSFEPVETGVSQETLARIVAHVTTPPPPGAYGRPDRPFKLNPILDRILRQRAKAMAEGGPIDWAFAETLAFGSLLIEGHPVRLSGQDSRRGTFSQRHAVWVDPETGEEYYPLRHLAPEAAEFFVYDSFLSEAAVLGFEYGVALDSPHVLVMWEAQFGDFANGAQAIIDQFIASGESKWGRANGVVLLLPHGYEGQGPEHSSARLERFLQLHASAENNIEVVYPTTPAQYFHLLRRQLKRNFRKPLIVMTPKSLLRRKEATNTVADLTTGRFREVLDDPAITNPDQVKRVILCSGKVYYDLAARLAKETELRGNIALVRIEQLAPWPLDALKTLKARYHQTRQWIWAQEESQNMGAWSFVSPRLRDLLGIAVPYVGRDSSASPATGSSKVHDREQAELVEAALFGDGGHVVTATPRTPHLVSVPTAANGSASSSASAANGASTGHAAVVQSAGGARHSS